MPNSLHDCIIIGTGFSGLAMAIQLKKNGIDNFIILEKANETGGTWRENTYPGAECDIPSALYSYSFEPYPFWEYKWSVQKQILEYIHHVVKKYKLEKHIHFNQEMIAAQWKEEHSTWTIQTKENKTFQSKTLVTAIGQLHHPSTPPFKGIDTFLGDNWHSAKWNHNISLEGKTIGVVGNAASAIQFIPEIAKIAKEVIVFQRTPNWMFPKQDRAYKSWEKKLVNQFPFLLKLYRFGIWTRAGVLFMTLKKKNRLLRKVVEWYSKYMMKKDIKNPILLEKLTPKYSLGSKRVLFSDHYYKTLAKPHVNLITGGVNKIVENGIITGGGNKHKLDIIIYSTGFISNPFLFRLDIKGKKGMTIQEHWKDNQKSYWGITTNNFPNLFMMYGPNTNLGHNSIILMAESQANYITQCITALEKNKWKSIEIKEAALNSHYQLIQSRLKKMVWSTIDNSWYKSKNGDIANNFPGRTMEYIRKTKIVDFKDYIIEKKL